MRRWLVLLVVALLVLLPISATAQEASPGADDRPLESYLPAAVAFGPDWVSYPTDLHWDAERQAQTAIAPYGGPAGTRVRIDLFQLPARLSDRSTVWLALETEWKLRASVGVGATFVPIDELDTGVDSALPAGANEALRNEYQSRAWQFPGGIGLYSLDNGLAAIVTVEGMIEGMSGIALTDWIASVIAAG